MTIANFAQLVGILAAILERRGMAASKRAIVWHLGMDFSAVFPSVVLT
jgi:hypothetical protein